MVFPVDGFLQLLIHVVTHGVTTDTEIFCVGRFQCSVKTTPEDDPGNKTTHCQYTQADVYCWASHSAPDFYDKRFHDLFSLKFFVQMVVSISRVHLEVLRKRPVASTQ
jgi:hypothetical protein